jgi:hypothetical protein
MSRNPGIWRFLARVVLFLLPLLLLLWWIDARLEKVPNNYNAKLRISRHLAATEVLITGSSHEFFGVDPTFLSTPAYNLANTSQTIYYDVRMVRHYLDSLPKLKLVIFGVSLFTFEMQLHDSPEAWRSHFYYHTFGIPTDDGKPSYSDLRNYSLFALYGAESSFSYLSGRMPVADTVNEYGWQEARTENFRFTDDDGIRRVGVHIGLMHTKYIPGIVADLDSMIAELDRRGVRSALMMSPVYRTYSDHVDPAAYAMTDSIARSIGARHGIPYHNYFRDPRFTIEDFANHDHVNVNGATKLASIVQAEVIEPAIGRR